MDTVPASPSRDTLVALNRAATTARLLAGAVHEVNNALMVIAGTVELLAQQPGLPDSVSRALDRIGRQGARAATALAEVLVFTKAPAGERTRLSLRDVAAHSVALRRFAASRANIAMEVLPDDGSATFVLGNRGQVQQILLNLLVNAEQALAPTPGVAADAGAAIRVSLVGDAERVGVRVADTGPGLPPGEVGLEPFRSTKPPQDAAGLGLWSARILAESHGGTLEVEPAAAGTSPGTGPGTSLVLWLPRG